MENVDPAFLKTLFLSIRRSHKYEERRLDFQKSCSHQWVLIETRVWLGNGDPRFHFCLENVMVFHPFFGSGLPATHQQSASKGRGSGGRGGVRGGVTVVYICLLFTVYCSICRYCVRWWDLHALRPVASADFSAARARFSR